MKAYRVVEFGQPIIEQDLAAPEPLGSQVVVDVAACGLCHSDLHFHEGHLSLGGDLQLKLPDIGLDVPLTLGHEIFGHIKSFGPDSGYTSADVGRPVIVYPWIGCGHCAACLANRDNECATPESIGLQRPGGHGEQVVVREPKFLVAAEGIEPTVAGVYACSGLTAYAALQKVSRDGWIAIIGMGGVGLMALAVAKGTGFAKVAALDIDEAKLALAKDDYGADFTLNSRAADTAAQLLAHTGGCVGVIDFVGSEATAALGVSLLVNAGTYVCVGLFGGQLHVPLALLASKQLNLRGSYVGTPAELRALVAHVRAGDIKPIPISSAPIAEINAGMDLLRGGKVSGRLVHVHAGAGLLA